MLFEIWTVNSTIVLKVEFIGKRPRNPFRYLGHSNPMQEKPEHIKEFKYKEIQNYLFILNTRPRVFYLN